MEPLLTPVDRFESEAAAAEFDRLIIQLEGRLDHLAVEGLEVMRGRVPRWVSETGPIWAQLGECIRGTLHTEWAAFRDGSLPGRLPDIDETLIVMASRVGDLTSLLAGYRFAQMALWGSWFELIEASVSDEQTKRELLRYGSQYFFQYADLVGRYMAEGYQRGVERAAANGEHHRFHAMKTLLEADPLASSHFDVDANHYHLGLVAWGEGADEEVRKLSARLGRSILLRLRLPDNWWGWISGSRPLAPREWDELRRFAPREGIGVAFGLEGFGERGLSLDPSPGPARPGGRLAGRPSVIHYDDVAVEALAGDRSRRRRPRLRRPRAARHRGRFDRLAGASARRSRPTSPPSYNAASAAATLGVHQQTVANRLRAIEERLGHPPTSRRVELAVALRLRASLARVAP